MKIGIVTFWESQDNYGQVLQCYALQTYLKYIGHEPYLIKYHTIGRYGRTLQGKIKGRTKSMIAFLLQKKRKANVPVKERNFDIFRNIYIEDYPRDFFTLKQVQKYYPTADCYIAGSDQIWAQKLDDSENRIFFLDFGEKTTKRISYAASFAMDAYPKSILAQLKEALSKFDFISVREKSGVDICKNVGVVAQQVVDPTLLLDVSDYMKFLKEKKYDKPYYYIYSININDKEDLYWSVLSKYVDKEKESLIVTPSSGYIAGKELFEDVIYDYATIEDWISNIYYSKCVITPSFHGILFSLLLKKNFIYIPLKGCHSGGNNRIIDLLKMYNLQDRIASDASDFETKIKLSIDYNNINSEQVDLMINASKSFLLKSLKN